MRSISILSLLFVFMVSMSSCELVGDIFKAGMWTSVILIVAVIALIVWILSKVRRK